MQTSARFCLSAIIGVAVSFVGEAVGQTDTRGDHQPFQVTTSVSIGLTGANYQTEFRLVDELGMAYDVMSLVENESVQQAVELTPDQLNHIQQLNDTVTADLKNRIVNVIASEAGKEEVKSRFMLLQEELLSSLDHDQITRLEQAKNMLRIERFGLAELLATEPMKQRLELGDEQVDTIRQQAATSKTTAASQKQDLIRKSNRALISELPPADQIRLQELLAEPLFGDFLQTHLFQSENNWKNKRASSRRSIVWLLRTRNVRDRLELTNDQFEEIKQLSISLDDETSSEIESELKSILTREQLIHAYRMQIAADLKKCGSVKALCHGLAGDLLALAEDESDHLFEKGKQIAQQLALDLEGLKLETVHRTLQDLPESKREEILQMIGRPLNVAKFQSE
jgi:hypothetical protein